MHILIAALVAACLAALIVFSLFPPRGFRPTYRPAALLAIVGLALLSGCGIWSKLTSPSAAPFIQAGVDLAVTAAEQKGFTAAQINAIAKKVLAADSGTTATVTAIQGVINAQILKLNLPAGDMAAAQLLTSTLGGIITAELQKGSAAAVSAQTQVAVAAIANDVIAVTGG